MLEPILFIHPFHVARRLFCIFFPFRAFMKFQFNLLFPFNLLPPKFGSHLILCCAANENISSCDGCSKSNSNDFPHFHQRKWNLKEFPAFFVNLGKVRKFHCRATIEKLVNSQLFHLFLHQIENPLLSNEESNDQFSFHMMMTTSVWKLNSFDGKLNNDRFIDGWTVISKMWLSSQKINFHINFFFNFITSTENADSFYWQRWKFNLQLFSQQICLCIFSFSIFYWNFSRHDFYLQLCNTTRENQIWKFLFILQENCFILNFVIPSILDDEMKNIIN